MSSPDPKARLRIAIAGIALVMGLGAGCTVRPLYSEAGLQAGASAGPAQRLASIAVDPVETREGQEVRNQLIFLLGGGAGQPAAPAYRLSLFVTSQTTSAALVQITEDSEPTAGTVTIGVGYQLLDPKTGKIVAAGRRSVTSSFDRPRQEYAALRANRDAQNRAAREVAELLRLAIAQDIERLPAP